MSSYSREKTLYLTQHPEKRKPDYWAKPARPVDKEKLMAELKAIEKKLKKAQRAQNKGEASRLSNWISHLEVQLRLADER